MGPARSQHQRQRLIGLLLGGGLFAFYIAVQYGDFHGWDGRTMANVAHNLLEHGRPVVTQDVSWWVPQGEHGTSPFGIGMSLILLPLWAVQRAISPDHAFWLTVANPVITAVTAVVVYRIGLALRWRAVSAAAAALAFGLLTMAPVYSIELFSEPAVGLCLAVALLGLVCWRPWMVGAAAGAAVLLRPDSLVTVVPLLAAVPLFVPWRRLAETWRAWLPAVAAPIALATGWTLFYNQYRFGSPFDFGRYGHIFNNPFLDGVQRQLLSSGKGFFWYDPILLAALPGLVLLCRRSRGVTLFVAAALAVRVAFFARWDFPDGSVAWGPRFLLPACPLLALGVGEVVERLPALRATARAWTRWALAVLAAASVVVGVASLWVPYSYTWGVVNDVPGWQQIPGGRLDAIKARRLDRQFNDPYWSPILLNLRTLDHSPLFLLRWWKGGPSAVGVIALAGAVAGCGGAVRRARRDDRAMPDQADAVTAPAGGRPLLAATGAPRPPGRGSG